MPSSSLPPGLPLVFTSAEAIAAGLSRHHLAGLARRTELRRLRRGVFCAEPTWAGAGGRGKALLSAVAVLRGYGDEAVLSGPTAAALWGLPLPPRWAGPVTVTLPPGPSHRVRRLDGLRVDVAALDGEVTRVRGLAVTSLARTVTDGIRLLGPADGVPLADAALGRGLPAGELSAVCARWSPRPGGRHLRAAQPLVDGRRESWLESRSVVHLVGLGVPLPQTQVCAFDDDERLVGRLDFGWETGVAGEADGLVKYANPSRARGRGALVAEKRREDALRRLGLTIVRWGWLDLRDHPERLAGEVLGAIRDARRRPPPSAVLRPLPPVLLPPW